MHSDSAEERSKKLEKIRKELRKHLDDCEQMTGKSQYLITQETPVILTPSEEKALVRHVDASHGDRYIVDVTFVKLRRNKHRGAGTRIELSVIRRRKRRLYVRL